MAALDLLQTRGLVRFVLEHLDAAKMRTELHQYLIKIESSEAQFCEGIIKHASGLKLTTDEWFKVFSLLPNKILHSELPLSRMLTEEQLKSLSFTKRD